MNKRTQTILFASLLGSTWLAACGDSGGTGGLGGEGGDGTSSSSKASSSSTKSASASTSTSSNASSSGDTGSSTSSGSGSASSGASTTSSSASSTVSASASATTDAVSTTATTASTVAASTTANSSSTGSSGCTPVTWTFTEKLVTPGVGAAIRGTLSPALGGGEPDVLQFEFYQDGTGAISLSAAPNDNYATCAQCAHVFQDSGGAAEKEFFQSAGSIDIDPASVPTEGDIAFDVTGLTLIEVTIDQNTFVSTPVVGGECLEIAAAGGDFFSVPPPNDTCGGALPLIGATTGTWDGATDDYSPGAAQNPCTGFTAAGGDVAYAFTLAAGQTLEVTVTPSLAGDPSLYVVSDCAAAAATCAQGEDEGVDGEPETLTFTSAAGGSFFLIVDSFAQVPETFTISATIN